MDKISTIIFGCRFNTLDFISSIDKSKYYLEKIVTISQKTAKKNKVSGYCNLSKFSKKILKKLF